MHGKFVTAINCMDGRVQEPVIRWAKKRFGADYVDMITEAGPDGILANHDSESIRKRVGISVSKHGSSTVIIAGHYDCAGNPGERDKHIVDLAKAEKRLKSWFEGVEIVRVWINDKWEVEELE